MANQIRICNQCPAMKWKFIPQKIRKLDREAVFEIGCQSECRMGYKKVFCIVNGECITGGNREELIENVSNFIHGN